MYTYIVTQNTYGQLFVFYRVVLAVHRPLFHVYRACIHIYPGKFDSEGGSVVVRSLPYDDLRLFTQSKLDKKGRPLSADLAADRSSTHTVQARSTERAPSLSRRTPGLKTL